MRVITCHTHDYHGYNVEFSPFLHDVFACAAATNYGLKGPGALLIFQQTPDEKYVQTHRFPWQDGIFDLSWSKVDQNFIATSSGDGSIQLWNILEPNVCQGRLRGHSKEVFGIDWCRIHNSNLLISASLDESIGLWDIHTRTQMKKLCGHSSVTYSAKWSHHHPDIFASVGGDGTLRLWDVRCSDFLTQVIPAHNGESLALDWSCLNEYVAGTGGVDNVVQVWDFRQPESPIGTMMGHEFAVRRVKFSPFHSHVIASVSYDFKTCLWNWPLNHEISFFKSHTEFVYGLDFSRYVTDVMIDCAWDSLIHIYKRLDFTL